MIHKSNRGKAKLATAIFGLIIVAAIASSFLLLEYRANAQLHNASVKLSSIPNLPVSAVANVNGGQNYYLSNNSTSYALQANGEKPVYISTEVFQYHNYSNSTDMPISISSIVILSGNESEAGMELISVLFGNKPKGQLGGYIQNTSNPLVNAPYYYSIGGNNITLYTIFESTSASGLPLYRNTSISPSVFVYTTAFQYYNFTGEVVSYSHVPLESGAAITLNYSKALLDILYQNITKK